MDDWQAIRKSDEEFLQGIYEKAVIYEQKDTEEKIIPLDIAKHRKRSIRSGLKLMASVAACLTAVIGTAKLVSPWQENSQEKLPESAMYRSMEGAAINEAKATKESVPKEIVPIKVLGSIVSVEDQGKEKVLVVSVDEMESKEKADQIELMVSKELYVQMDQLIKEQGIRSYEGCHVLVYVEQRKGLDSYQVVNDQAIYLCVNQENEEVYMNINKEELKSFE